MEENNIKKITKKSSTEKTVAKIKTKPLSNAEIKKAFDERIRAWFEANKEYKILVSPTKLLEANANIGLPTRYWNPKMKPYIYSKKNGRNYTIDLLKCMVFLSNAYNFLYDLTKEGGQILLVGTHGNIIKEHVKEEAKRCGCYFINQRWLGGTLTNFRTINRSIMKLNKLIMMQLNEDIKKYSKKEQLQKYKETEKLAKFLGGIRTMKGLPQAIIVIDPIVDHNAVVEAKKLHIPVIALANVNADPDLFDFTIPCNTSSVKTTYLFTSILCDAICEAKNEPTKVVGKSDDEIILPNLVKNNQSAEIINRKQFTKAATVTEEKAK